MKTCDVSIRIEPQLRHPLCRRYTAVVFSASPTFVHDADAIRSHLIRWALGCLSDGQLEVLGAWNQPDDVPAISQEVLADLRSRGAEFISFTIGDGLETVGEALADASSRPQWLESIEQRLRQTMASVAPRHRLEATAALRAAVDAGDQNAARTELAEFRRTGLGERYPTVVQLWEETLARLDPLFALPAPLRQIVRSADRTALEVQVRLTRAIHRHGPFVDPAAALDFIAKTLLRAEQRLDRERARALAAHEAGAASFESFLRMSSAIGVPTLA